MEFFDSMERFRDMKDVRMYTPVSFYSDIVQRYVSKNGLQDKLCRYFEESNTTVETYTCYVHRTVQDVIAMVPKDRLSQLADRFGMY